MARTHGSINKNKRGLKARLREEYGEKFDVIMLMGKECMKLVETSDMLTEHLAEATKEKESTAKLVDSEDESSIDNADDARRYENTARSNASGASKAAIDGLDKLAQYVEPKLKSIELSTDPDNPFETLVHELTATERAARLATLLDRGRDRRDGSADNDGGGDMDESARASEQSSPK